MQEGVALSAPLLYARTFLFRKILQTVSFFFREQNESNGKSSLSFHNCFYSTGTLEHDVRVTSSLSENLQIFSLCLEYFLVSHFPLLERKSYLLSGGCLLLILINLQFAIFLNGYTYFSLDLLNPLNSSGQIMTRILIFAAETLAKRLLTISEF